MNYRVEVTQNARIWLKEIAKHIGQDNPERALRFIDEITDKFNQIFSLFPYSGQVLEESNFQWEIRVWSHKNYISYYRVIEDTQTVEILYIFNASKSMEWLYG